MRPKSFDELATYCMQELGAPVIDIAVAEEQVQNRIEDAFDFFTEFHGDSSERALYKHQVTQDDIDAGFITLPDDVIAVTQVLPFGGSTGVFSPEFQYRSDLLYQMLQDGAGISGYVTSMSYLQMVQDALVGEKIFNFNRFTHKLTLEMNWSTQVTVGSWLAVAVYRVIDIDEFEDIFNNRSLKKLAVAYVKKQWGSNTKLFGGVQLPGGVTINGQQIYDEAMREVEMIEEEIKTTYQEPPMFLMG